MKECLFPKLKKDFQSGFLFHYYLYLFIYTSHSFLDKSQICGILSCRQKSFEIAQGISLCSQSNSRRCKFHWQATAFLVLSSLLDLFLTFFQMLYQIFFSSIKVHFKCYTTASLFLLASLLLASASSLRVKIDFLKQLLFHKPQLFASLITFHCSPKPY